MKEFRFRKYKEYEWNGTGESEGVEGGRQEGGREKLELRPERKGANRTVRIVELLKRRKETGQGGRGRRGTNFSPSYSVLCLTTLSIIHST
jgi:hypothetical protein